MKDTDWEAWVDWLTRPEGKRFFALLAERAEDLEAQFKNSLWAETEPQVTLAHLELRARAKVYLDIAELGEPSTETRETIEELLRDDESERD